MAKKKITLPKDFTALCEAGDLEALKAVFKTTEINAYERDWLKKPALSFYGIPLALMQWLIDEGADINVKDYYERTPLHYHGEVGHTEQVALLLQRGANPNVSDTYGNTPLHFSAKHPEILRLLLAAGADLHAKEERGLNALERALSRASNIDLPMLVEDVAFLLQAGLKPTKKAKEEVSRISKDFEFVRERFNPEFLEETEAAVMRLCELLGVTPTAPRVMHAEGEPIVLSGDTWQAQFESAWQLLVPGSGAAKTLQGEVVRIAGRINDELLRNGMGNWYKEYRKMLTAFGNYVQEGNALSAAQLKELAAIQAAS